MFKKAGHIFVFFVGMYLTLLLASTNSQASTGSSVTLSFPWNNQVSSAVFFREGYLWIVFDRKHEFDLQELARTSKEYIKEIVSLPHPKATILRLLPTDKIFVAVRKEGLLWIVDIFDKEREPLRSATKILTEFDGLQHSYLFIPSATSGNAISIIDPLVGDTLLIIPSADYSLNLPTNYSYPDLEFLQSVQGIAIVPNTDDLYLNKTTEGISIKAQKRSLHISNNLEYLKKEQLFSTAATEDKDLLLPHVDMNKHNFIASEHKLITDLSLASANNKQSARTELAKFYIGHGLGTNALGLLAQNYKANPNQNKQFYFLRGLANFLTKRYQEASADFSNKLLEGDENAIFWQTITQSQTQIKPQDNAITSAYIYLLSNYPEDLKERASLAGAHIAISAEDDVTAHKFLDILKNANVNRLRKAHIKYITGKIFLLQGYPQNALREFTDIARSDSQKWASFSRKEIANLAHAFNFISISDATQELEKIYFAWHTQSFREQVLHDLIYLYSENQDYHRAIEREYELYKMQTDEVKKAQTKQQMITTIENLFLEDVNIKISAFKILALYDSFNWIAVQSPKYNSIVRKLVDRLVAVDLLERAKELIKTQLADKKTPNTEKQKLIARLALIYLFENAPTQALKVIQDNKHLNADKQMTEQIQVIKARAYIDINRPDLALKTLEKENTKNAILLKTDLYMKAQKWEQAADSIKQLIEPAVAGKPLSDEQAEYILDWALALKKAGKETVLVRLRNSFLPQFEKTKYYSPFSLLTSHLDSNKIDLNKIEKTIDDTKLFSNFVKSYNKSLQEIGQ